MDVSGFLVIGACLGAGLLLRRDPRLPAEAPRALSAFVVWVPLPALVIAKMQPLLHDTTALRAAWVPVSMAWIQMVLAVLTARALRGPLGLSRSTEGALAITLGLGNTAFVGYPLVEALLGPAALPFAVLADQPGSFLVLSTVGVVLASSYAGPREGAASPLRAALAKALRFPPMIALLVAIVSSPWTLPIPVATALDKLSAALVPASLVAVGMQLRLEPARIRTRGRTLFVGLGAKLVVFPLLFVGLYVGLCQQSGLAVQTTLLEAAMPPMVTGAVLVEDAGLDTELASGMIGLGIVVGLLTVPLFSLWFRTF